MKRAEVVRLPARQAAAIDLDGVLMDVACRVSTAAKPADVEHFLSHAVIPFAWAVASCLHEHSPQMSVGVCIPNADGSATDCHIFRLDYNDVKTQRACDALQQAALVWDISGREELASSSVLASGTVPAVVGSAHEPAPASASALASGGELARAATVDFPAGLDSLDVTVRPRCTEASVQSRCSYVVRAVYELESEQLCVRLGAHPALMAGSAASARSRLHAFTVVLQQILAPDTLPPFSSQSTETDPATSGPTWPVSVSTGLIGDVALLPRAAQLAAVRRAAAFVWDTLPCARPDHEPPRPVLWRVLDTALRLPAAEAIRDADGRVLTYAALVAAAERVRCALEAALPPGVDPARPVACAFGCSALYVVATLAAALAHRAYVPLTPRLPPARIAALAATAQACAVLSERALQAHHHDAQWPSAAAMPTLLVDPCCDVPPDEAATVLRAVARRERDHCHGAALQGYLDRLAYIRYTSGSTGEPKGVRISQRALAALHASLDAGGLVDDGDVALAVTQWTFDVSEFETYVLTRGGRVALSSEDQRRAPDALFASELVRGATCLSMTPTVCRLALRAGVRLPYKMFVAGEALALDLVRALFAAGARFVWNGYGPTETTYVCTQYVYRSAPPPEAGDGVAPVGRPLPGYGLVLVDLQQRPQLPTATGELVVFGPTVGDGYVGRAGADENGPFLTGVFDALLADDSSPDAPAIRALCRRSYRVGDLVRYDADGELHYLGRRDTQVKIRGIRVDLSEIESAIVRLCPGVAAAAVSLRQTGDLQRLVAYVVRREQAAVERGLSAHVAAALRCELPAEQIPNAVIALPTLPTSAHGKLDRACIDRLPLPSAALNVGAQDEEADRSALEALSPRAREVVPRLCEFFCSILHLPRVGVRDDFFDLGGTSMGLTRLVGMATTVLRLVRPVPPSAVLSQPTPVGVARVVEPLLPTPETAPEQSPGGLDLHQVPRQVPVQVPSTARFVPLGDEDAQDSSPEGAPVFLVHPAYGSVVIMSLIAFFVGRGVAVTGIEPVRPLGSYPDMESIAEDYASALLLHPLLANGQRRFVLGGWSLGGNIAHAMERALVRWGRAPAALVLIDAPGPSCCVPPTMTAAVEMFHDVSRSVFGRAVQFDRAELRDDDPDRCVAHVVQAGIEQGILTTPSMQEAAGGILRALQLSNALEYHYHARLRAELAAGAAPCNAAAPVLLFRARDGLGLAGTEQYLSNDGMLGWRAALRGRSYRTEVLPCGHNQMPTSSEMAQSLRDLSVSLR